MLNARRVLSRKQFESFTDRVGRIQVAIPSQATAPLCGQRGDYAADNLPAQEHAEMTDARSKQQLAVDPRRAFWTEVAYGKLHASPLAVIDRPTA